MKKLIAVFIILISGTLFAQQKAQTDKAEFTPAENVGSKPELKRFLKQEMNYPENALKNKIQGTVELVFVMNTKTGATSQLKIQESVSKELDAEAIRLYNLLLFNPPYYKGSKLTTYCSLKIKFNII